MYMWGGYRRPHHTYLVHLQPPALQVRASQLIATSAMKLFKLLVLGLALLVAVRAQDEDAGEESQESKDAADEKDSKAPKAPAGPSKLAPTVRYLGLHSFLHGGHGATHAKKVSPASASWRQISPQAAPSFGQPQPIHRPAWCWPAIWALFFDTGSPDKTPKVLLLLDGKEAELPDWYTSVAMSFKEGKKKSVSFAVVKEDGEKAA